MCGQPGPAFQRGIESGAADILASSGWRTVCGQALATVGEGVELPAGAACAGGGMRWGKRSRRTAAWHRCPGGISSASAIPPAASARRQTSRWASSDSAPGPAPSLMTALRRTHAGTGGGRARVTQVAEDTNRLSIYSTNALGIIPLAQRVRPSPGDGWGRRGTPGRRRVCGLRSMPRSASESLESPAFSRIRPIPDARTAPVTPPTGFEGIYTP